MQAGKDVGAEVWTEEVCPQLLAGEPGTEAAVEARLDVRLCIPTTLGTGAVADEWVDVTVTHPWKAATRHKAATEPGTAARQAAERKAKRYGPGSGGVRVRPFAVETWGRLGPEASELLQVLSAAWAAKVHAHPRRLAQQVVRWKENIGAAVVRAMASTVAHAGARPALHFAQSCCRQP